MDHSRVVNGHSLDLMTLKDVQERTKIWELRALQSGSDTPLTENIFG